MLANALDQTIHTVFSALNVPTHAYQNGAHAVRSPIDGSTLAKVNYLPAAEVGQHIAASQTAFEAWR